jgi:hypothetical protein
MNEQDFRGALRDTMSVAVAPPPMNEVPVLDAARRAQRLRRARLAGAASAAAVAVLAVGVAITTAPSAGTTDPGGPPPANRLVENGPNDGTRTAGPEFERSADLVGLLAGAVPPGLATPDGLMHTDPAYGGSPLRYHQVVEDLVDGTLTWQYLAGIPVQRAGGLGDLEVEVMTEGGSATGNGCDLTVPQWEGIPGSCVERVVDGKLVALNTVPATAPEHLRQFEQWATYRYPDGTVVLLAQSADSDGAGRPAMTGLPLSENQLLAMVTDPRFHLD